MTTERNSTSTVIAARPLGMARVSEEPPSEGILVGYGLKRKARRNGHRHSPDANDQIAIQTVESPNSGSERYQRLLVATESLATQVRQLPLRNPRRGRYVNALQALMAGESGDVGRIAFLITSPVGEAREQLCSLVETGVASAEVGAAAMTLYSLAKPSVE